MTEIAFQAERLQYPRIDAKGNSGVATFDPQQRGPGDARALCNHLGRVCPPQPRRTDARTQGAQQAHQARKEGGRSSSHNG